MRFLNNLNALLSAAFIGMGIAEFGEGAVSRSGNPGAEMFLIFILALAAAAMITWRENVEADEAEWANVPTDEVVEDIVIEPKDTLLTPGCDNPGCVAHGPSGHCIFAGEI